MNAWSYMWHLFRFSPWLYIASSVLSIVYSALPLAIGLIMRAFFNALTGEAEAGLDPWTLVVLYLATTVGIQVSTQTYTAVDVYFYGVMATLLRKNIMQCNLKDPGPRTHHSPGEIINRFEDDVNEFVEPLWNSIGLAGHVASAVIALGVMTSINPLITAVAFVPMAVAITLTNRLGTRIQKYHQASREATGRVTGYVGEILGGVQAINVAGTERSVIHRLDVLSDTRRRAVVKDRVFTHALLSMNSTATSLAMGVVLILSSRLMRSGSFTVGDLALFVSYIAAGGFSLSGLTGWLGRMIAEYRQAGVSLRRLFEITPEGSREKLFDHGPVYLRGTFPDVPYDAKTEQHTLKTLEVDGLSCRHADSGRGVQDLDLYIEKGSFTVITGRVGSGKTTVLKALLGLVPREAGEIRWNGELVENPASFLVPPRCAYTSQVPRLFSDTLKDNVLMGLPEDRVDLDGALHSAVMEQDVEQLENGLGTLVGPRGVRLSGGQVQRTAAARMFVRDPELLVFDDLSSALDVETESKLWSRLSERGDATCLVVSHRRNALRLADHIIVLKDGKVEAKGRLNELLETCAEMQRLWKGDV